MTGRIFDIKRYSTHDGPGIRTTVFFKGCPLHCQWCHNPEGIERDVELMHWPSRCVKCYFCLDVCPRQALSKDAAGAISVDRTRCDACGLCAEACVSDAMQMAGRDVTVPDLVAEVERDRIFFEQSGGGVTFSGGDPLAQPDFLAALLEEFRARGLSTAVDTSGFAGPALLEKIAAGTDLVLYDLKLMDDVRHRAFTGVSNGPILDNLRRLAFTKTEVWVRIPLLAGVNDDEANVRETIGFLTALPSIRTVGLLPYHSGGTTKAGRLGTSALFRPFEPPSAERYAAIEAAFRAAGFNVRKGG